MAFDTLSDKIQMSLRKITGKNKLTEKDIESMMKEIRLSLLEADVNYKVVKEFTKEIKEEALGERILKGLNPDKQVFKIVQDKLTELMGKEVEHININNDFSKVLLCGLQGAGKTTHCAKLALHLRKKEGKNPIIIAADIYRPAAIEQLVQLGKQLNISVFEMGQNDPRDIVVKGVEFAKENNHDVVIIDTAGRLHIDTEMMEELKDVYNLTKPDEVLLTVDSMTGQDAVNVANSFHDLLGVTGCILTKLDGDTRGGAALSIRKITNIPVKFMGVGEKPDQLEIFHPERMASRILGMGDMASLVEKAMDNIDEDESMKLMDKMMSGKFDFNDYLKQMKMIKRMGSLSSLFGLMPGARQLKKQMKDNDLSKANDTLKVHQVIISSMTSKERKDPLLVDNYKRKKRIAKGSGTSVKDVDKLLDALNKQKQVMKMMGNMSPDKMENMMNNFSPDNGSLK